ncbi:hypothetical protein HGRIS_013856 [Hohenbuehelia grisea]|uniref:NAD(P)-binding protein n=1 Tax=Hohenbuehelia grisea TaxID=104357 RepID=A0ABR3IWV2_9AGAR
MSSQQLVWLITGTSSGFGRRLVQSALSRGDLVIASARCLKSIQDLAECPSHQGRVRLLELDVSSGSKNIKHQVDIAVGFFGRIDVLVNNAGHAIPNILEEGGSECLRKQFEVNVFGVIDMANAAAPHMRAQGSGTIVNIGSRSAWKTEIAGIGPYSASKAAIHALTETLAAELAQFNIRVLLVAPGAFRTESAYKQPWVSPNPMPEYATTRNTSISRFNGVRDTMRGDPAKAMEVVVDVVRGEGVARGRERPMYLFLGEDAEVDLRAKLGKITKALDDWVDVTRGVSFDST